MHKFSYRFRVKERDIDFNGHVHNVTYLSWMIESATKHSESVGFDYEKCLELGGTWAAKSHNIEYKKPALENDELLIETWIESIGKVMSVRRYRITATKDKSLTCEGKTEWVFVDKKRMGPTKIPTLVIEAFN